jgi:hypothetical protein
MNITILSVQVSTKPGKTGKPYQTAEVVFKNMDSNKVESKNITQYSKVFKQAAEAQPSQSYTVTTEKDEAGYWQWITMDRVVEGFQAQAPSAAPSIKNVVQAPKSTYETPEERAKKQVYIVKQSSLGSAIELLTVGAKTPPNADDVIKLAQKFTDWVFAEKSLIEMPNDPPFDDVEVE